ncbi:MAG: hypothetical protein KDA71_12800 [Planctomycetales bacterium]|nr:hypothetical protein [Planctomycetales bacterium]
MKAEDLLEILAERPFQPIRLHLEGGRVHEIRHPEMAIVTEALVAIGMPRDDESGMAEKVRLCSLPHVVEVEPIEVAP